MSIDALIVRQTRNGDWIAKTPAGIEVLLPRADTSLALGLNVSFNGLKQGDHVHFPDGGYHVQGNSSKGDSKQVTQARPVLYNGVIISDHSYFSEQTLYDHWEVLVPENGQTHLNKSKGPQNIDIGTLVDIHKVRKEGKVHRWIDDWSVSSTQYPMESLTPDQVESVDRLRSEHFSDGQQKKYDSGVGTVALHNRFGMVIVSDLKYPHRDDPIPRRDVVNIWHGSGNPILQVGTRVLYGPKPNQNLFLNIAVHPIY